MKDLSSTDLWDFITRGKEALRPYTPMNGPQKKEDLFSPSAGPSAASKAPVRSMGAPEFMMPPDMRPPQVPAESNYIVNAPPSPLNDEEYAKIMARMEKNPFSVKMPQAPPPAVATPETKALLTEQQKAIAPPPLPNAQPGVGMKRQVNPYEDDVMAAIDALKRGIATNEGDYEKLRGMSPDLDLSPTARLLDLWTGSNFMQGRKPPETPQEMMRKNLESGHGLQTERSDLLGKLTALQKNLSDTDDASKLLKTQLALARLGLSGDRAMDSAVSKLTNHPFMNRANEYITRLYADADVLVNSNTPEQVLNEINMGIARVLSGSSAVGIEMVRSITYQSLAGEVQKLKNWINANPGKAPTPAIRKTMYNTINRLYQTWEEARYKFAEKQVNAKKGRYSWGPTQEALQGYLEELTPGLNPIPDFTEVAPGEPVKKPSVKAGPSQTEKALDDFLKSMKK